MMLTPELTGSLQVDCALGLGAEWSEDCTFRPRGLRELSEVPAKTLRSVRTLFRYVSDGAKLCLLAGGGK